jgi:glycosyltransferase involved in cell wall biosynthesis
MGLVETKAGGESPSSPCVYVDASPFFTKWFGGIPRYAARLALALAECVPVRFFCLDQEIEVSPRLDWSQDQDLARWGRRVWRGRRKPLEPAAASIGLYCLARAEPRRFPFEVGVLHDFTPLLMPGFHMGRVLDVFGGYYSRSLPGCELILADSQSTKADAAWLTSVDPARIRVAYPGPSLCVARHAHSGRVKRSDRIGLVVSTVEPRKNARFLIDWFRNTSVLSREMELWWVGPLGWKMKRRDLVQMSRSSGGRRIRFLGAIPDAQLCRLLQRATWSIYPSLYEGFGFPVLDALRHGTPVLTSYNSSLREFDSPGVSFFDPCDPATVDLAYQEFEKARPIAIPQEPLDRKYSWTQLAKAILEAYAEFHQAGTHAVRAA